MFNYNLMQSLPNYMFDQTITQNNNKICKTECLLKYNFQENSSSFKTCLNYLDLKFPYINITNEFLKNTDNTGTIAVNFQKKNYWFDTLCISKPGRLYIDYKVSGIYNENGVLKTELDASACSLVIICKDSSAKNYLIMSQLVIGRPSSSSNPASTEITNIINNIKHQFDNDPSRDNKYECDQPKSISSINLNNFINVNQKYFYYNTTKEGIAHHNIIFNGLLPIQISNNSINDMNSLYNDISFNDAPINTVDIPKNNKLVFISSQPPINNLSEGDDDIYIKCQPTNQEGEILVSGKSISPETSGFNLDSFNFDEALNKNLFTTAALGIVLMMLILKGGELIFKNSTNIL